MADKYIGELSELITAVSADMFVIEDQDDLTVAMRISGTNLRLLMRGGLTASRAVETNASGVIISSTITSTELRYLNDVTSSIQTQLNTNTAAHHTRSHAMTGATDHSASTWKLFHSDNTGVVELAFSASAGDVLTSGGLSSAPTWTTPHGRLHTMKSTADHQSVSINSVFYADVGLDIQEVTIGATDTVIQGSNGTSVIFAKLNHSQLDNIGTNDHQPRKHAITAASDHTANTFRAFYSDTSGDVIEVAIGATNTVMQGNSGISVIFAQLNHSQLANVGINNHHNKAHVITSTNHNSAATWKVLYVSGTNQVTELALGANGTYLKSTGVSSAPVWDTPSGGGTHAASHQNGGGDEINVGGLSGVLADAQTPSAHTHPHSSTTGRTVNDHHDETHTLGSHSNVNVNVDTLGLPDNGEQLTWNNTASEWVSDTA